MDDRLIIDNKKIKNRLFVGTGKFPSKAALRKVLETIEADVVTVALRRVDIESKEENILDFIPKTQHFSKGDEVHKKRPDLRPGLYLYLIFFNYLFASGFLSLI